MSRLPFTLSLAFIKIFLRDRQAIFFSLFFPVILMSVFAFIQDQEPEVFEVGVVNESGSALSEQFVTLLKGNSIFNVSLGSEDLLRKGLIEGNFSLILIIPPDFQASDSPISLTLLVDAAQVQQLDMIKPALEQGLLTIERQLRNSPPLFSLMIEDVRARSQSYLDFLLPGLLAFILMQLAISGSGFNLVEYRRKGILKRLFVTPLRPSEFIAGIVISRLLLCLAQLTILLAIAIKVMGATIAGSYVSFYVVIFSGIIVFLCLGFFIGSLAKTQQSVMAIGNLVIFPQVFLSGIFYPIDSLPDFIEPVASVLPLSFIATALREIAVNGEALLAILPQIAGIIIWLIIGFGLASRFFIWKDVAS